MIFIYSKISEALTKHYQSFSKNLDHLLIFAEIQNLISNLLKPFNFLLVQQNLLVAKYVTLLSDTYAKHSVNSLRKVPLAELNF